MKKLLFSLAVMCLVLVNALYAYAADDIKISAAYGSNEKLYAFVNGAEGYDSVNLTIDSGNIINGSIDDMSNAKIRYIFVLDESQSMGANKNDVQNFVEAVVNNDNANSVYTLQYFGEAYHDKSDEQPDDNGDKNTFLNALRKMTYYQYSYADPYTALYKTLDDINNSFPKYPQSDGEMVNIVLITKYDYFKESTSISMAELENKIRGSSNIVVHTYCLGNLNSSRYESLTCGSGLDFKSTQTSPADAGKQIADFVNNTQKVSCKVSSFPNSDEGFSIKLVLKNNDGIKIVQANNVSSSKYGNIIASVPSETSDDITPNEETTEDETTTEETTDSEEITEDVTNEKVSTEVTSEESSKYTSDNVQSDIQQSNNSLALIIGIAVLILMLMLAAVLYIIFRPKKNIDNSHKIFMRIEMISGECLNKKTEFYLADELIIGSSKKCDIILRGNDVSLKNSRIFIKDKMIYIEDLNSKSGTYLGGMQIYGMNRLRSTDEISIGSVRFIIKF